MKQMSDEIKMKLSMAGVEFAPGLTEEELSALEVRFGFIFPRTVREFYRAGLPVGGRFPDWRDDSAENLAKILRLLDAPLQGVLFDVEENEFWLDSWGEMPEDMADRLALCREKMTSAPRLIPLYGHRYCPVVEEMDDPPVLSVMQTDIIFYGHSLENYWENEFMRKELLLDEQSVGEIPVWDEIMGR